jgi:sterol desaturase/sphingolipid hydroxylase (fatty acid hydroxylase superfamily)
MIYTLQIAILHMIIAWVYGHIAEYSLHRWLLHKWGAKKGRPFSFHFYGHHSTARLNKFFDKTYVGFPLKWNAAGKELAALIFIAVMHTPVYLYSPPAYFVLIFSICQYYYVHRKSHRNPMWAKEKIPWHYDHHMLINQNMNYGVRSDIIDKILGTRVTF